MTEKGKNAMLIRMPHLNTPLKKRNEQKIVDDAARCRGFVMAFDMDGDYSVLIHSINPKAVAMIIDNILSRHREVTEALIIKFLADEALRAWIDELSKETGGKRSA